MAYIKLARPKQWIKNVLVVAAPGAAGVLGDSTALFRTAIAFVCFCLAASGTYFMNDALDVEADRRHPTKRNRPIAPGEVSVRSRDHRRHRLDRGVDRAFVRRALAALARRRRLPLADVRVQPVAEARSRARPRVRRVGLRAAHDRGRRRSRRYDLAVVPDRCRLGVAVHGHGEAPRRDGGARRRAPASHRRHARDVLAFVPQLRARGLVERHDPRVLPVGVREVGEGRQPGVVRARRSCRSCSASCATRCSSNRAAAARRKISCSPIACCSRMGAIWAVLFALAVHGS